QAIGGVNRKIEGFFDVCRLKNGLTGEQGVLVPRANLKNLMLRRDVVQAVQDGKFQVYAVDTIDEGIEILTGIPAGERDAEGRFPPSSINGKVEKTLDEYARKLKRFSPPEAGREEKSEDAE
ncbi:MAG TPA: ATP-dependent protease, partial [Candidatus Binatia bacterium]